MDVSGVTFALHKVRLKLWIWRLYFDHTVKFHINHNKQLCKTYSIEGLEIWDRNLEFGFGFKGLVLHLEVLDVRDDDEKEAFFWKGFVLWAIF